MQDIGRVVNIMAHAIHYSGHRDGD